MRLAPGLHQIGSDVVNIYLVVDAAGVTIIDAGLPGHWRELDHELTQLGRSIDDVRGIVLTHGDSDHIGLAERLRQGNDIVVHVHELDAARARGEISKPNSGWGPIRVRPLLGFLWYGARHGGLRTRPVREVVTFADGEELDLPGSPRIIHVPGHTPGSVAVHAATVDALFVGDAMTTRSVLTGERGPRPAPFSLDPDAALASLAKLEAIPASWVLPGHGPPWRGGVAEAVRQVRQVAAGR
jgi:glyoxylase-like metal-dependent hydrolase (beta-lactamase superfamily II)